MISIESRFSFAWDGFFGNPPPSWFSIVMCFAFSSAVGASTTLIGFLTMGIFFWLTTLESVLEFLFFCET